MQLPARIGKYELLEFLGGGMSHVYRAQDTVLGRMVAVKILTEEGNKDAEVRARFLNEARMAGNIVHDNIVAIHDYGEEQGRPYLVMEFLRGENLRDYIYGGQAGDLSNRLRIALQTARALEYVHAHKVIHRDIKPENIHLDATGRAKLMDFGIAKSEDLSLTKSGTALGTPYYMAPEQILGQSLTEHADVYAFGVLLYELVVGRRPVAGETIERIFYVILNEPLDLEPLTQSGAPPALLDLIRRATAKRPEERHRNFTEIVRGIESLLGVEAPAPAPPPIGRRVAGLVALGAAAAVAMFFAVQGLRDAARKPPPLEPVLANASGQMVLAPAGDFLFGEKKETRSLPAFYIDRTEVTNAAYARFCSEKSRPTPQGFEADKPHEPVVNITVVDAQEFARWAGKRLPTPEEWEKAARGVDGRAYSWGNEPEASRANVKDNARLTPPRVRPAASFDSSASPFGALHMTGNVWEFVAELRTPSPAALEHFARLLNPPPSAHEPWYVIKGGAYDALLANAVAWEWSSIPARFAASNIGFRCAKDP